ncbi:hypothetical protein [Paenibacillus sp. 1P07SE]|uniref:hypothetical protein n=1 Tax=Paenibacillus sp. 1P07SE TaxID=3132209 RepID=UPI0039A77E3A
MRKIVSMLLCLALLAGILPVYAAQASEPGTGVPGLKQVQVLNSCEIMLVFDRGITYNGGDGGYPGELPCSPSAEESESPEGITVAVPGGDALDLATVVNWGDSLLLVLDQPLADQDLLDITILPGVITFEESDETFELTAYRVMTPLGTLGLMTQLDPQRTGFHVGHAVQYMRGPGAGSVAGAAGLDHQDASFLLSLVEVGPVDREELGAWIERAQGALASGDGYPEEARGQLETELTLADQAYDAAVVTHREIRNRTVALERAVAAFVSSYEEPEQEFGAEIASFNLDGPIYGFNIAFNKPVAANSQELADGVIDRVELFYGDEEEPVTHFGADWEQSWIHIGSVLRLHLDGGFPSMVWVDEGPPMELDRVKVYFVEGQPVSVSGAVYPAGVPVVGHYGSWWPEEPEVPLYVIAGAPTYIDSMMHSFRVEFSEPLGSIGDLVSHVRVYYDIEVYDTYEGEQLAFSDFEDAPDQRFEISLLSESLPDLTEVREVRVYFSDEVQTEDGRGFSEEYAIFRPVDIELYPEEYEQMGAVYVPEYTMGWDLLRFLSLHGYEGLEIRNGAAGVPPPTIISSGMTLWDYEKPVLDIRVHRLYQGSEPPAASFRNTDGIDRIKQAYDWQYYDRRDGGHFWDEWEALALVADEAAFRSAIEDEEVERVLLLDDLDLAASFTFPNRDLWLGGEGRLLTIPGIENYLSSSHSVDSALTVIDTSLEAPPEVAYLPEFAVLYENWSIQIGFDEPLTGVQQSTWLPQIEDAFIAGFQLQQQGDITVSMYQGNDSIVTITNISGRTLDFSAAKIYLRSESQHPFVRQVKIFDPNPLHAVLSLSEEAEQGTTRLEIAFNQQLSGPTLDLEPEALIRELSYWDDAQIFLQDRITDAEWTLEADRSVLALTIGDYEYDSAGQHNLMIQFQDGAIRNIEGDTLRPGRWFSLLPTS